MNKIRLLRNKEILWYSACTLLLGLMDQRRGSAPGNIQILFANLIGVAVLGILIPSIEKSFWRSKGILVQGAVCAIAFPVYVVLVRARGLQTELYITGGMNVVIIAFLIHYILRNRKDIFGKKELYLPGFGIIMLMLFLMLVSVNKTVWPGLYLVLFACFYLIGIPQENREKCMLGILCGLALWFIIQQAIALAFRPYDYLRYKGLYSGETQNGLFYMISFCAFTGLALYAKEKKMKKLWIIGCFVLSAGCVSLLLLTGGKSSLFGAVVGGAVGYLLYDLFILKKMKRWFLQGSALVLCIALLFPVAYGCVRYIPAILHHPVWFEGEYDDENSVRSFDPWNSERYIPFERVVEKNLGRMLKYVGIKLQSTDSNKTETEQEMPEIKDTGKALSAQAEDTEPGTTKTNPYLKDGEKSKPEDGNLDPARVAIWRFYLKHLNWEGHSRLAFYYREGRVFVNAHNMFLHVAVLYGIIPGLLFLVWHFWCLIRLARRKDMIGIVSALILTSIFSYGLFEQAVTTGQISLSLIFLLYYFGLERRDA